MRIRVVNAAWYDGYAVLLEDGEAYAQIVTMRKPEPGEYREPTFRMTAEEGQALIDELWHCGLRPTEGHGSAGSLKATQEHLADLRTLLWHTLKVK